MSINLLEIAITAALFGLIWTVQLVLYPAFAYIAEEEFLAFHRMHTQQITIVVLPLMLSELALAGWGAWTGSDQWQNLVPLMLVLAIWGSTFLVQVPIHNQLADGKDMSLIQRLVQTNWWRTILWTGKLVWLCAFGSH